MTHTPADLFGCAVKIGEVGDRADRVIGARWSVGARA
jgi:hypothetical protein